MTDESDLLRRLIEKELEYALRDRPTNQPIDARRLAEKVVEEVLRQLERMGAQVVRMHANHQNGDDD